MEDLAIVLTIFDGYEDLWDDCVRLIEKNWENHPPIYAFTNEIVRDWKNVKCIPVGKDAEWSKKVQKIAQNVEENYVVMLLEDFYIGSKIDINQVEALIKYMKENNILYAKLCDNNKIIHKARKKIENGLPYEVIYKDEEYGISLQAAIWNKDFLLEKVGNENYNAWVFEINQLKDSQKQNHEPMKYALYDKRNILHIKHGALQGKMLPGTVRYFEKIKDPLKTNRKVMSKKEYFRIFIKTLGKDITPKWAEKSVKDIARKFGYTFVSDKWR